MVFAENDVNLRKDSLWCESHRQVISLFPSRAFHDGTAITILLLVFFHAEGNHLPASADPAVGSLYLQLFITERAGKHSVVLLIEIILQYTVDTV